MDSTYQSIPIESVSLSKSPLLDHIQFSYLAFFIWAILQGLWEAVLFTIHFHGSILYPQSLLQIPAVKAIEGVFFVTDSSFQFLTDRYIGPQLFDFWPIFCDTIVVSFILILPIALPTAILFRF